VTIALAGWNGNDPTQPCNSTDPCMLGPFAGQIRDVNSIVLLCNGISFALQAGMFLLIGSFADYGTWRPWITISFTLVAWGISFGWLGVETPDKWQIAAGLYIVGLIAYQGALTFWTAAFPQLARDLPEMMESEAELVSGQKTVKEHEMLDVMSRNRISNMSFVVCNAGEVVILAIMVGILKAVNSDAGTEQNTRAFSILIAFSAAAWVVCALPWFIFEKRRPGRPLPSGSNYLTVAVKNLYHAFKECMKLKQTC
jgi:MFS-type transporter involved in bile tolerance (Atg22 family)